MEFKADLSFDSDRDIYYPWVVTYWRRNSGAAFWFQVPNRGDTYSGEGAARRAIKHNLKKLRKQEAAWPHDKKETIK